jgi:hypothetical protein
MNRKEFLRKTFQTGLFCCAAGGALNSIFKDVVAGEVNGKDIAGTLSADLGKRMLNGSKSPDWHRMEKSVHWIKQMMVHIDRMMDESAKVKLLNACGHSCFERAYGVPDKRKHPAEFVEGFLKSLEKAGFKIEYGEKITTVYYGWLQKQNPMGLSMKEGFCMCPIVEGEKDISGTFCNCSAGYVQSIFEVYTGKTVRKVEILESLKRGGKDCRFKVEIVN